MGVGRGRRTLSSGWEDVVLDDGGVSNGEDVGVGLPIVHDDMALIVRDQTRPIFTFSTVRR